MAIDLTISPTATWTARSRPRRDGVGAERG